MTSSALLPWLALAPFAGTLLLAPLDNRQRQTAAWLAGPITLAGAALVAATAPAVFSGDILRWSVEWLPALGLRFGFRMDGLAWMFALLITGIGALVVLYAACYLGGDDAPARFFLCLKFSVPIIRFIRLIILYNSSLHEVTAALHSLQR